MASDSDSPQAIASEAEIDALEYVVEEGRIACKEDYGILRSWLCRLRPAWESTPSEPSTPGEGTRQAGCTLTDAEREAILYCVSCAQDYRDKLDGSDDRATQMIEIAMRLAVGPAPVEGPRTASVTDVGGAGPTITHAEREALEIAVEYVGSAYAVHHHAATLRGLLERTK